MISLPADELHLWQADLARFAEPHRLAAADALLDAAERQRRQRFLAAAARARLTASRGVLRSVLSTYHDGIAPADWHFEFNAQGRPAIATPQLSQALYFNLSHSGPRLVIAVSRWPLTGVDVEVRVPGRRFRKIARRYFSDEERRGLEGLPEALLTQRFYALWTLKEAYIKARGMGLAIPLKEFSIAFPAAGELAVRFAPRRAEVEEQWKFWLYDLEDSSLAVALNSGGQRGIDLHCRELLELDASHSSERWNARRLQPLATTPA